MEFDRILATINTDALLHNLYAVKERLKPDMKICAVVKADGYGNGAELVVKTIEEVPFVWGYAVATVDEGLELCAAGVDKPILLLGHPKPERFEELILAGIRPAFFEPEKVRLFSEAAKRLHRTGFFHVKIDTGMNRIGMRPDEDAIEMIRKMVCYPSVQAEGIFTHLATADMLENEKAHEQNRKFRKLIDNLKNEGITFPIVHTANSASSMIFENDDFSMCRLGIALYGMYPSEEVSYPVDLRPVLSLYSEVMYVKTIPSGEAIGYGGTYVTDHNTRVATVSCGYADGYARSLSNKAEVLIRGKRCKVLGRICMDQMMVCVDNVPDAAEGDIVTLIGTDGDETITMDELADLSGRFNYEFTCDLNKRIPRVPVKD